MQSLKADCNAIVRDGLNEMANEQIEHDAHARLTVIILSLGHQQR
jgi:hypothetical protein